jgi:acyl dehydratase
MVISVKDANQDKSYLAEGSITDEAIAEYAKRVGMKLRIGNIHNTLASQDAIRHFAFGIGDDNPLWNDEEYAKKTRYGGIIAPQNWLYSVFPTWVLQGLPGVHAFHSGNDWEFYKPIRKDDVITPECHFTGFEEKKSEFAGKIIIEYQEAKFTNQRQELVAKTKLWIVRAERQSARGKGKYTQLQLPHPWTEEELTKIEDQIVAEEVRGSQVRYWEDVQVGEELPNLIKGPFGLTDMVAYCVGAAPVQIAAHSSQLRSYRKHPAWGFRDPGTLAMEPVYSVHYNLAAANSAGLPFPYDVGAQRQCWLLHFLNNWIGDEGWIKKNYAEYRKFVYFSDVIWFKGKVTNKYVDENGEHCVDIEHHGVNQRGEDTIPGHSTVVLPSKEKNTWPVAKRI